MKTKSSNEKIATKCVLCGGNADIAGCLNIAGLIYKDKTVCAKCCFDIWDSINEELFVRSRYSKKQVSGFGKFYFTEDSIRIKNEKLKHSFIFKPNKAKKKRGCGR